MRCLSVTLCITRAAPLPCTADISVFLDCSGKKTQSKHSDRSSNGRARRSDVQKPITDTCSLPRCLMCDTHRPKRHCPWSGPELWLIATPLIMPKGLTLIKNKSPAFIIPVKLDVDKDLLHLTPTAPLLFMPAYFLPHSNKSFFFFFFFLQLNNSMPTSYLTLKEIL